MNDREVTPQPTTRLAAVHPLPIPKSWTGIFHHVKIEGLRFRALAAAGGPYLDQLHDRASVIDQVPLGVCSLTRFEDRHHQFGRPVRGGEWWICKYTSEARINVTALSEAGRAALMREFGIALCGEGDDLGRRFLASPAFHSLKAWVAAHPRIARDAAASAPYIPTWYERATGSRLSVPNVAKRAIRSERNPNA